MSEHAEPQATAPLEVVVDGQHMRFVAGEVRIGRDPASDVAINDELVSRSHARFVRSGSGWHIEDTGSRNGTWVEGVRLTSPMLVRGAATEVRLGDPNGHLVMVSDPAHGGPAADRDNHIRAATIVGGRSPDCDLVVDDPQVSRRHFRVVFDPTPSVEDLGSYNGTFVNGDKVIGRQRLRLGDRVEVGSCGLVWDGLRLEPSAADSALILDSLVARTRGGKVLLDHVSLALPPDSLTAVIGPSGAGKSTLLAAMTGDRPAQSGRIEWQGQNLYDQYENLRNHIGLVPQDDIVHPQLKVRAALRYAARLRLPPDSSSVEIEDRVESVVERMRLGPQADQRIGRTLSGGQRKRVSIAMELLTAPPLLFLDEPTSGLDPALDREVMTQLRALANEGRIVVTVTHSVQALELCDRVVVMAPGGRVAYVGPPTGVFAFFNVTDYVGVFQRLADPHWSLPPAARVSGSRPADPAAFAPMPSAPSRAPFGRQFGSLVSRSLAILAADGMFLLLLITMPILLALLAHVVPGHAGLSLRRAPSLRSSEANQRLTILVVGAALMGTALTVREIIREAVVLRREHAVGLSPAAYWCAKLLVFGTLGLLQGALFAVLALVGVHGPDGGGVLGLGSFEVIVPVALATACMAVFGLVLSLLVRTSEQVMPALVGMTMVQLVLSGALIAVAGRTPLAQLAWFAPARWNYVIAGVSVGLQRQPSADGTTDPLLHATSSQWWLETMLLVALGLVAAVVGRLCLQRTLARETG